MLVEIEPGASRMETPAIPMLAGNCRTDAPRVTPPAPTCGAAFSS
ncbi:hypothetical protein GGC47_005406 [Bosea sp. OAE752]